MLRTMFHGFLMALADSVPGVSGGTIAFIMGFYERFLGALSGLLGKDRTLRRDSLCYLLQFVPGWGLGMGVSVLVLARVFETNIYFMSSLFLGLTLCAIPFILRAEKQVLKINVVNILFGLLGVALVILLTVFRTRSAGIGGMRFQNVTPLQCAYLLLSGALAISAMLLPGISGSTLLLILGVYVPLIGAVKELLHFQLQYLPGVLSVAVGILLGIFLASGLIRMALRKYRGQTVWLILGLMVGSLYAIAMGPMTLDVPKPALDLSTFRLSGFVIGAALLGGLEWMRHAAGRHATPINPAEAGHTDR